LHPNGDREENKSHLGIYLCRESSSSLQFRVKYQFQILSELKDLYSKEGLKNAEEFDIVSWGRAKLIHHDKLFDKEGQFIVDEKFTIALEVRNIKRKCFDLNIQIIAHAHRNNNECARLEGPT
jgi:hypothetical protein